MASRISQMRNAVFQQQSLSDSIARTRAIMQQIQAAPNPQTTMINLLSQNPQLASLIKSNGSLENYARELASEKGIDINKLINQLQGGLQP